MKCALRLMLLSSAVIVSPSILEAAEPPVAAPVAARDLSEAEQAKVLKMLKGRSFDKLVPGIDADPRSIVRFRFHGTPSVYAQRAEKGRATSEWELSSDDLEVIQLEQAGVGEWYQITMKTPKARMIIGDAKIDVKSFVFHIKPAKRGGATMIRLARNKGLPTPMPMCQEWTKFRENIILNGG